MCSRKPAIDTHLDYSTQTFLLHSNLPYDLQSHGPWHPPPTLKVPWIPYIVISKNLKYLGSIFNTNRLAGRPAVNYLNSQRNLYLYSGQVLISANSGEYTAGNLYTECTLLLAWSIHNCQDRSPNVKLCVFRWKLHHLLHRLVIFKTGLECFHLHNIILKVLSS